MTCARRPQVEELQQFARDPIILADDVSPLDGFQFLTGFSPRPMPYARTPSVRVRGGLRAPAYARCR